MKIKFPIDNDTDAELFYIIIDPELFYIEYAQPCVKRLYNSMTEEEKQEIRDYANKLLT